MDPVPPQTVPVNGSLRIFDVTLVGVNPTTGLLLMTIGLSSSFYSCAKSC